MKELDKTDFHLFETTHPYFIELGLGSFTTGTLLEWWNERDSQGRYLNRKHINTPDGDTDDLSNPSNTLKSLLGITDETEFFWNGWKTIVDIDTESTFSYTTGRFKRQNLKGLGNNTGGSDDDVWVYTGKTSNNTNDINEIIELLELDTKNPVIGVNIRTEGEGENVSFIGEPIYASAPDSYWPLTEQDLIPDEFLSLVDYYYQPIKDIDPLYSVIQLNKFMNHFEDFFPRNTWSVSDKDTHKPLTTNQAFGSWAFLNEIKSAKGAPYIQWSGDIKFFINQSNIIENCEITESGVLFKLYLTDESMSKGSDKSVTIKNMTYVGPKRDATGASPGEDGTRTSSDQEDISRQTAGEIDLQWNPVSKKWQSGNVNMLAKLVTNVGPGKAPSLEFLLENDIKETLDGDNLDSLYIPARGSGMPIRTQNSMPLQWSPNYAQTEDSRCNSDEPNKKQFLTVYNFNPRKAYPSGEEVLLTLIDDIWHISDLGQGDIDEDTGRVTPNIGKWGPFTYMMTSSQHFFRAKSTSGASGVSVTPRSAELNFHKIFYSQSFQFGQEDDSDYVLNRATDYGPEGNEELLFKPPGGYNFSQPFNTKNHIIWHDEPGYLQTTSFDYLDSQIYGIRGKESEIYPGEATDLCSISSTSATINSAGNAIPFDTAEFPYRNAAHCGVFFGCVFPNGYIGTDIYDDPERDFTVTHTGIGVDSSEYFVEETAERKNPFDAGDGVESRNDCTIQAIGLQDDPFRQITFEGNLWDRGSFKKCVNMFYLGAEQKRKTIPADVMLNASPEGKWGSPIKPIELYRFINDSSEDFFGNNDSSIYNAINGGAWLHKRASTEEADPTDSAFDFQPDKRDNIMFRPLKMEAYRMFGWPITLSDQGDPPNIFDEGRDYAQRSNEYDGGQSLLSYANDNKYYKYVWAEACQLTHSRNWPMGRTVPEREFNNTKANIAGYERGNAQIGGPLKWGEWTRYKPYYNRLHDWNYWNSRDHKGGMFWINNFYNDGTLYGFTDLEENENPNWRGAGAFGVITTSLKIIANDSVEFVTSNLFGMNAAAHGDFTIGAGHSAQDKTWGVSNFIESYKQENITDLSVRIYQGHPVKQTLYDPRYFAVHHFNPGVEFLFDQYKMGGPGSIPVNQLSTDSGILTPVRNYSSVEFKNLRDKDGNLLSTVPYVYPIASGLDYRIPSRYEKHIDFNIEGEEGHHEEGENKVYHSVPLKDEYIYQDATRKPESDIPSPPLMKEQYWCVGTKRNGKLLPYKYTKPTLGHPYGDDVVVEMVDKSTILEEPIWDHVKKMIIENYGNGFEVGDAVGNLDRGIVFKITATGENGSVSEIKTIEGYSGSGILNTEVPTSGTVVKDYNPKLLMLPLTGNGQGFRGILPAAKVKTTEHIDPKPFLIKRDGNEITRIAANKSGPSHNTSGFSEAAEASAYVTENQTVEFLINPLLKSDDNSYDIFFHYHNDISFNWLVSGSRADRKPWGDDGNNPTEATEQHVTIEGITLV